MNRTENTTGWLMVRLYYNSFDRSFYKAALQPIVKTILQTGISEYWFFTHNQERGSHLRLYFQGNSRVLQQILKINLKEHFENYFDLYPSERITPNFTASIPSIYHWLPNNSIHFSFSEKEPLLAHQNSLQFHRSFAKNSSNIILTILSQDIQTDLFEEKLKHLLFLHSSFILSIFEKNGTYPFVEYLYRQQTKLFQNEEQILQQVDIDPPLSIAEPLNLSERKLKEVHALIHTTQKYLQEEQIAYAYSYQKEWLTFVKTIAKSWANVYQTQLIQIANTVALKNPLSNQQDMWKAAIACIKDTNNRLGISPREEIYINQLLLEGMKTYKNIKKEIME